MTIATNSCATKAHRKGPLKALLIDLDDTLYRHHDVANTVRIKIQEYMRDKLGVPAQDVEQVTQDLYAQYGTTMCGLVATGHQIDYDDWHRCVHHEALDYEAIIHPDIVLRELLCSINLPKYVLTNADHKHAELCLARLGISDCFQGIYDFEWVMAAAKSHGLLTPQRPVMCKPAPQVYQLVLEAIGCKASEVAFFDDSLRNVASAHELGITTVLVGCDTVKPGVDIAIPTMHHLPTAMPELLDQPGLVHDSGNSQQQQQRVEAVVDPALEQVAVAVNN